MNRVSSVKTATKHRQVTFLTTSFWYHLILVNSQSTVFLTPFFCHLMAQERQFLTITLLRISLKSAQNLQFLGEIILIFQTKGSIMTLRTLIFASLFLAASLSMANPKLWSILDEHLPLTELQPGEDHFNRIKDYLTYEGLNDCSKDKIRNIRRRLQQDNEGPTSTIDIPNQADEIAEKCNEKQDIVLEAINIYTTSHRLRDIRFVSNYQTFAATTDRSDQRNLDPIIGDYYILLELLNSIGINPKAVKVQRFENDGIFALRYSILKENHIATYDLQFSDGTTCKIKMRSVDSIYGYDRVIELRGDSEVSSDIEFNESCIDYFNHGNITRRISPTLESFLEAVSTVKN